VDKPIHFDCDEIRVPKYILKLSDDSTLIVKDFFDKSVNLRLMFGAEALTKCSNAHGRRQKPEQTSCSSSNLMQRRMIEI
jgi:hypothetical protein